MWKPLTGEPCAGKPHARFGGRGGRKPFSTPIKVPLENPRGSRFLKVRIWSTISSAFGSSDLGALRRYKSLMWLGHISDLRLALHPNSDGQIQNLLLTISLTSNGKHSGGGIVHSHCFMMPIFHAVADGLCIVKSQLAADRQAGVVLEGL